MAGYGSPPPGDRSLNENRVVTRDSGMLKEESEHGRIFEYRPPVAAGVRLSDRGTRYGWDSGDIMAGGRGGSVRTLKRARTAVKVAAQRRALDLDRYTGR